MAAATRARLIRGARRLAGALLALPALYLLAGWAGAAIPRNGEWREGAWRYAIGVESNGVHTALVMPVVTPVKDWRADFPLADLQRPDRPYTHVALSWGEREVFLNTPTWGDLTLRTVLRVLLGRGEGLAHVSYLVRPQASEDLRVLRLTDAEYARLVAAIERQLPSTRPLQRHPGYGAGDVFYESGGRYTPVRTCNQWTSDRLAEAGVRTGWWTPFAGGVMWWLDAPARPDALTAARPLPDDASPRL